MAFRGRDPIGSKIVFNKTNKYTQLDGMYTAIEKPKDSGYHQVLKPSTAQIQTRLRIHITLAITTLLVP